MFTLKPLSHEGVAAALEKAERYRLLNEPWEAESICHDILAVEPENQRALVVLLLAITDQFGRGVPEKIGQAHELLPRLREEYDRVYYGGLIAERQAKAILRRGVPGSASQAYEWFRTAMEHFERAEAIRPPGNDDALLRWNACARTIMQRRLGPHQEERTVAMLE
ncbi:MAG TPA: hypothetical protein VNL77_12435 [Roseiflexaceae bacterium]|nr:hypothetical protein [Roseiflexaceae bacterium]